MLKWLISISKWPIKRSGHEPSRKARACLIKAFCPGDLVRDPFARPGIAGVNGAVQACNH